MTTAVPISEEDPALAVVRFVSELSWADAGPEVAERQVMRLCVKAQECMLMGRRLDLVSLMLASAEVVFSKVSEKDLECIFSVISNVVTKSESPDEALEMVKLISAKITQQPNDKPASRLKILFNLYNLLDHPYSQFYVYSKALTLAIDGKITESVVPWIRKIDSFLKEWNVGVVDQRKLFLTIINVLKENKSAAKETFKFQTKYLETYSVEDAQTLSEAKEEAVNTIIDFVKAPDMFQCDLLDMPAVAQLEKDPKYSLVYQLLKIFLIHRLDAYLEFQSANSTLLKGYGLDHEDCITKMRLMSLADLRSDESGQISYSLIKDKRRAIMANIEEEQFESPNNNKLKRKSRPKTINNHNDNDAQAAKRFVPSLSKPSSSLGLGSKTLRSENRARLTRLLRSLVSQRNWVEASGVLSVLLKSTIKDKSVLNNRFKYTASMEVLANIGAEYFNEGTIKNIYDVWIKKTVSFKQHALENGYLVRLERIVFWLTEGNIDDAYSAAKCVMDDGKIGVDPLKYMIVGLVFYQLWISTIPKEVLCPEKDRVSTHNSQISGTFSYSQGCDRANTTEVGTGFLCDSASSVGNNKIASDDSASSGRVESIKGENLSQGFNGNSAENTGNETSMSNHVERMPYTLSALEGLNPSLFPIRLPQSTESGEDLFHFQMGLLNKYYTEAVKYLRLAVCSTPPLLEALVPFTQLLLVGGQVDEAMKELDKLCCHSTTTLPLRLRASFLEHFDHTNIVMLSTCFEDILKKDPTCCSALEKLITMNHSGEYSSESLLEMIASHLDSSYANYKTWKEFALCFLKVLEHEEDHMSVCLGGSEGGLKRKYSVSFNKIPKIFTKSEHEKNWRLRCRWWLSRHFSCNTLASETASGDLQLLAYKAACASHIYGPEFAYVVEVYVCLEKHIETDLLSFLKLNIGKSIHLYSSYKQKIR